MFEYASQEGLYFSPAIYRIRVRGRIPRSWSGRLEGMAATVESSGTSQMITTLVGELADQASVVGVVNALYNLRLTVLSIERLDERESDQPG